MIGETIGNFKIVAALGSGGMGEVYLAEQTNIGTKVAVKVLRPQVSKDTEHVQRFFNEARAVSKIQHAGIVKIFDVGYASGGEAYLIMEYLEGETLAHRIERDGKLPLEQIADLGKQIASVLGATHGAGITHRDLKPDNIYIIPDRELARGERVKVLDFGIAKLTGTLAGASPQTIGTMGTPAYMAPEQWGDASKVDWRADVYSLGCVAFEMATGRPPFIVTTIAEACAMHLHEIPPRARTLVPELPAALDELLARLLEKKPEARPQSMQELARAFEAIGEGRGSALVAAAMPTATKSTLPPATAPTMASSEVVAPAAARKSRAPLLVAAGIGIVGVAGAATYLAVSREEHAPARTDAGLVASHHPARADAAIAPAPPPPVDAVLPAPVPVPVDAGTAPKHPPPPGHATIDRKAVEQQFAQHHPQLVPCFKHRGAPQKLVVSLTIEPDGNATQIKTDSPEPNVDQCVVDAVDRIRFPKPSGGSVSLDIPLELGEIVSPDEQAADPELRKEVVKAVQGIHAQLQRCAVKYNLRGRSSMHLDIAPDGSVRHANVNGFMAGQPFEACVAEELKKLEFAKQPHAVSVNFPVMFR